MESTIYAIYWINKGESPMPYVVQEQKNLIAACAFSLADKIYFFYYPFCAPRKLCLLAYKYVCLRLGIGVLSQRRYALLSAVRAVYSDASFEMQRRLKIKPKRFANSKAAFLTLTLTLDNDIKMLSEKIIEISSQSREPYLAWQGLLNYSITIIGLNLNRNKDSKLSSQIVGVLEYLHRHFYDIEIAPYEDEQIIKNGDVF